VEALREFQAEAGLDATGEADQATVEAVLKGTKAKVVV
jgi:murein L,D-transpeptidase YcbB/YkuD